ncbi:hypothetical protein FV139_02655 [Parahaliea maris]|uniref:DUF2269 family protein n=1 Tax=Parahaliea maris TaxID=2716870 RepID=A0A5C9A9T0_9GAMM|nr:hypothetical protein [Parahaliea maris]TXS96410.1 hypothetical protein FV139_02655 [Parahaliea maris]
MSTYLALKFAHLIAFVYWLGGDLGTFLASRQVMRTDLGPQARATALGIMLACDMGPKLAMPLILPIGLQLASDAGMLALPGWALPAIWLAALLWAGMVLFIYLREGQALAHRIAAIDFWFRIAVVLTLLGLTASIFAGAIAAAGIWLGWKLLIFSAMVCCGLVIRVQLKPFGPAFGAIMAGEDLERANASLQNSITRCRPWVWCIWAGLFINAALGLHLI